MNSYTRYTIWRPYEDPNMENSKVIEALDLNSAAETWAELEDIESRKYGIAACQEQIDLCVKDHSDDDRVFFLQVTGEIVAYYTATYIQKGEPE